MSTLKDKYQSWGLILSLFSIFPLTIAVILIVIFWNEFYYLGEIRNHYDFIRDAIVLAYKKDYQPLYQYVEYVLLIRFDKAVFVQISIPIILSFVMCIWLAIEKVYVVGGRDTAIHITGPKLYIGRDAINHAKNMIKIAKSIKTIKIHPKIYINNFIEMGNIFVVGSQGSGKSTIIKFILRFIINTKCKCLIYDAKREYTELFSGSAAILLSPLDERSICWDICSDINDEMEAFTFAQCFIEEVPKDKFWTDGARLILAGCIVILIKTKKSWDWSDLTEKLYSNKEMLKKEMLTYYPLAAELIIPESKQTQGYMSVLATNLSWLSIIAKIWTKDCENKFSIKKWLRCEKDHTSLIVPNDPKIDIASRAICAAALAVITNEMRSLPDDDNRRFWFILDELADIPKTKALVSWLAVCRAKGARTLAGTQNFSQLDSLYGLSDAETMMSLFAVLICLKIGSSHETASKLSKILGTRRIKRPTFSFDKASNESKSFPSSEEALVRPEDLMHLSAHTKRGVTGFLCVTGWDAIYKLRWPHADWPKQSPSFVPLAGTQSQDDISQSKRGKRGRIRDVNSQPD